MGVTVRHNAAVAAVVALLASVMTVAWFARALQTGSPVDWALTLVLAAIGVLQLLVVRDGRAPLLVADEHGVRVRRGRTWSGLRWQDVAHVEVRSPGSWLRDGEIVVHPVTEDAHERFSVPLGMTTRVDHDGLTGDLVGDLDLLASGEVPVLVLTGVPRPELSLVGGPREDQRDDLVPGADLDQHAFDRHAFDQDAFDQEELDQDAFDQDDVEEPAEPVAHEPARELEDFGAPVRWRDRRPWQTAAADTADESPEGTAQDTAADTEPLETDLDDTDTDTSRTRDRLGELRRLVALGVARAGQRRRSDGDRDDEQDQDGPHGVEEDRHGSEDETAELAAYADDDGHAPHLVDAAEQADRADAPVEPVVAHEAEDRTGEGEREDDVAPVEPGRATRPASRAEVVRESVRALPTPPPIPEQRAGRDEDVEPAVTTGGTGNVLPAAERPVPVLVARLDDLGGEGPRGPEHPVIGPRINAARHRARLSIDTLGERTRIRPHVLERIEVDDFEACGGDFYARGHLRTLARIFGLDAEELVALYDEHYASPEIEARQVFEAELASGIGGGVRAAHSGPRWSLLAASVLVLAGVWGISKVVDDTPQELVSPAPQVVDSAGLASSEKRPASSLAPVEVRATGATPEVVVRDRGGRILWAGRLADGQRQQVIGLAPFEVTSSNGGAVRVSYLGRDQGVVGQGAAAASKRFGSR